MFLTFLFSTDVYVAFFWLMMIGLVLVGGIYAVHELKKRIHEKHVQFVIENSQLLKKIDELNAKYHFHVISDPYVYREVLTSKTAYDKTKIGDVLDTVLSSREIYIRQYIEWANENKIRYRMYCNEYERIMQENDTSATYYKENTFFAEIEYGLCLDKKDRATNSVVVTFFMKVIKQYTSPQGRNHYEDSRTYTAEHLLTEMDRLRYQKEHQREASAQRSAERAKMTDSLRYDILRRDGFKCCICGATAEDGIKLHVDHIKPVAKGGKTEKSNLRTLCDRCNHGKGAKYTPNGKN